MAEDLTNIRLSSYASDVAERFVSRGFFDYATTAAKFAMGYALKNHYGKFDPTTYQIPDNGGSNYNVGSFDGDGQIMALIKSLYPDTNVPYQVLRALMVYGLTELGEMDDYERITNVSQLM